MRLKSGSIVVACLLLLSIIIIFTEQLLRNVLVGTLFTKTMTDREHAEMLALGGIQVAIASLTILPEKKDDKLGGGKKSLQDGQDPGDDADPKKNAAKKDRQLLARLLPHLNRWRSFPLTQEIDGIDGQIKICISSENGKININEAFAFKKQELKKEYEALLGGLEVKGKMAPGDMLKNITEYFKKRKRKLDEISELSLIPGLEHLNIFYEPPVPAAKKNKAAEPNAEIMLQDIFTIWSGTDTIEPLLFSDALCSIFSVRRPTATDASKMKEAFKKIAQSFSSSWLGNWESNWENIEPIYGEKPKFLDKVQPIFSKQFGPKVYSVISCGRVGNAEQKVLAIIRETKQKEKPQTKDVKHQEKQLVEKQDINGGPPDKAGQQETIFKVEKIYWL